MYNAPKDFLTIFLGMQRAAHKGIDKGLAPRVAKEHEMALSEALCGSQRVLLCEGRVHIGRKAVVHTIGTYYRYNILTRKN